MIVDAAADEKKTYELPPSIAQLDPVDAARAQPIGRLLDWMPTGAVLKNFIMSPRPVTCIMGPYGSGKTTGGFIKGLLCSCVVPRSPVDGVRYARGVVVRDTYRNLEMNTIPSWHERFPPSLGTFKGGGGGEPAKAVIDFEMTPGEILHLEVIFAAIGDHNVKTFCDGFQATWAFLNSLDSMPPEILAYMRPRLGRWPPPQHRPDDWKAHVHRWRKLFGDMNAPDIDNWTYGDDEKKKKGFVECKPENWELFIQPGGMEPNAENLANLEDRYYEQLMDDNELWWVNRFVHNKFGYSRAGQPVYPEWNDQRHVARADIPFDSKRKLHLGLDAGRDPVAIAMQRTYYGAVHVLDEFVPGERMGAKRFGKALSEWLAEKFPDAEIQGYCDPAAADPTQDSEDDAVWMDTVKEIAQIPIKPAPTNALGPRLESVRDKLTEFIEERPMFLLSPRCKMIRRGFNSGYRFPKVLVHGDAQTGTEPVKNEYSHPHDGLQYVCLGSGDYRELKGKRKRVHSADETEWNPHG